MSWILITVSFGVCGLIYYGYLQRQSKELHMKIMLSAFAIDLVLVFIIEFNRSAIEKASGFPGGILGIHILFSILTIVLYIWQIVSGLFILSSPNEDTGTHRFIGMSFMVCRGLNFITSLLI